MKYATRIDAGFVNEYKHKKVPWGPIGYIVYKRTYARRLDIIFYIQVHKLQS